MSGLALAAQIEKLYNDAAADEQLLARKSPFIQRIADEPHTLSRLEFYNDHYADLLKDCAKGDVCLIASNDAKKAVSATMIKALDNLLNGTSSKLILLAPDAAVDARPVFMKALKQILSDLQITNLTHARIIEQASPESLSVPAFIQATILVSNADLFKKHEMRALYNILGQDSKMLICGKDDGNPDNGFSHARRLLNKEPGVTTLELKP